MEAPNYWTGTKVKLRAWEPEDWEAERRWSADTDGQRGDYRLLFPRSDAWNREEARERAEAAKGEKPGDDRVALIIATLDGAPAGVLTTDQCDNRNGTFSYGVYVGPEHRRKGLATEAVTLLLRYYFRELRYQKANAGVFAFNEASVHLQERLGFQLEGRLRNMHFSDGAFHDELRYGLTAGCADARPAGPFATETRGVLLAGKNTLPGALAQTRLLVSATQTTVRISLRLNASPCTTTPDGGIPGSEPLGCGRLADQISP